MDVNISCADGSLSRTMRLYTNEYAGFHSEESNSGYKADGTLSFNRIFYHDEGSWLEWK